MGSWKNSEAGKKWFKQYYKRYKERNKERIKQYREENKDRDCKQKAIYRSTHKEQIRIQHQKDHKKRYEKSKQSMLYYKGLLGGKCACGSTEKLAFHHLDPSQKLIGVSELILRSCVRKIYELIRNTGKSHDELIRDEVMKCILLCESCHAKLHAKLRTKNP